MTVAELRRELLGFPPEMPVGILYDGQHGFYPVHEVKVSTEGRYFAVDGGVGGGTDYVCVCDAP